MDERELVTRAAGGDESAFEQLVLQTQKMVYNLCLRMSGNPDDAYDLSQEAYLRAWRGLSGFQQDSGFSTWLYRLASNVCIDHLRSKKRRPTVSLQMEDDGEELELPDESQSPETLLVKTELRQSLELAINSLEGEYRQALTLRELGGLSYAEIASVAGVPEGTVKSRIARAREKLRRKLISGGNISSFKASDHKKEVISRG